MKSRRLARLRLEQLESRLVPSLTVMSLSGTLFVSGTPVGASPPGVVLTETAPNSFQVQDGASNLGTYAHIANVNLNLTNHQNRSVNINLNGNTLSGNLFINEGAGDTTSNAANGTGIFGGRIGGSLTVVGGSGEETLVPGFQVLSAPPFAVPMGLSVGGDIVFNGRSNLAPFAFNVLDTGILFGAGAPTVTVGGSIQTTNVDALGIGQNTTVGKNLTYSVAPGEGNGFLGVAGTVRGGVQATFGNGTAGNTLDLTPTGNVGGSLQAGMGNGPAIVLLEAGSTVGTSVNISSGAGNDSYAIAGQISGNASFNVGDGNDSVTLDAGATVFGNLTVTAGGGNESITLDGAVSGNLRVTLGNGNDTVTIGNAPGGILFWTSGSGNDSVTFGDATNAAGETWNVQMRFGSGNDTLTLAGNGTVASPEALTGFIDMGGPPGGNAFDPTGSLAAGTRVIVQPFTLQNV
jgi:hypothetical protein